LNALRQQRSPEDLIDLAQEMGERLASCEMSRVSLTSTQPP
jgi:hypothetical protein